MRSSNTNGFLTQGLGTFLALILQIVATAIMSRHASKEAFGMYAYGIFFWGISIAIAGCGQTTLLVQKHTKSEDEFSQAHWLSIRVAIAFALILAVGSECISIASGVGPIRHSLLLFATAIAVDGYAAVPEAKLLREEQHGSLVKADTLSLLISLLGCAIPLVALDQGELAPSAHFLATRMIRVWILIREPSVQGLKSATSSQLPLLSKLGLHFAGIKLLYQLTANIDQLIVGLLLGPIQLGVYNRASAIAKTGIGAVGNVIDRVLFARLSRLQTNPKAFDQCLKEVLVKVAVPSSLCAAIGSLMAGPLVKTLLGNSWQQSIPVFIIFASSLPIFLVERVFAIALRARGQTVSRFKGQGIGLLVGTFATVGLSSFGPKGCAVGTAIGILLGGVYSTVALSRSKQNIKFSVRIVATTALAAILSALAGLTITRMQATPNI